MSLMACTNITDRLPLDNDEWRTICYSQGEQGTDPIVREDP